MDFDEAITAHSAWKLRLSNYLRKPDGSLKAADIEVDNKCVLGQWIYGEGAKYNAMTEYELLRSEHAKFHKAAAEVVKKADTGQSTKEDLTLGGTSDFAQTSTNVVKAIMAMRQKAV